MALASIGSMSVGFIVSQWLGNDCCENRVVLFLIGQKIRFMTLVFWDGVPEVGEWSRTKLRSIFVNKSMKTFCAECL